MQDVDGSGQLSRDARLYTEVARSDMMMMDSVPTSTLFFFNDTATTEIYTLSLHDALPI